MPDVLFNSADQAAIHAVPSFPQLALLYIGAAMLALSAGLSLARLKRDDPRLRAGSARALLAGLVLSSAVLIWHCIQQRDGLRLSDNFSSLLGLGVLLALFATYVRRRRAMGGLDAFVLPIAAALVLLAGVFGRSRPHEYVTSSWFWLHRVGSYGGALLFAIAAAGGAAYLLVNRSLRGKRTMTDLRPLGSLEKLERLTYAAVTIGFALLSVGMVTGLVRMARDGSTLGEGSWLMSPKVGLALSVWLVYAIVLHTPIQPTLRGRRSAALSVAGFVLMVAVLVVVQFMPSSAGTRTRSASGTPVEQLPPAPSMNGGVP